MRGSSGLIQAGVALSPRQFVAGSLAVGLVAFGVGVVADGRRAGRVRSGGRRRVAAACVLRPSARERASGRCRKLAGRAPRSGRVDRRGRVAHARIEQPWPGTGPARPADGVRPIPDARADARDRSPRSRS